MKLVMILYMKAVKFLNFFAFNFYICIIVNPSPKGAGVGKVSPCKKRKEGDGEKCACTRDLQHAM